MFVCEKGSPIKLLTAVGNKQKFLFTKFSPLHFIFMGWPLFVWSCYLFFLYNENIIIINNNVNADDNSNTFESVLSSHLWGMAGWLLNTGYPE